MHHRSWTDPRDGRKWNLIYNPGVELARPKEKAFRSRMIFEADGDRLHTAAVFGSDLSALTDEDIMGLLDQARAGTAGDPGAA